MLRSDITNNFNIAKWLEQIGDPLHLRRLVDSRRQMLAGKIDFRATGSCYFPLQSFSKRTLETFPRDRFVQIGNLAKVLVASRVKSQHVMRPKSARLRVLG